MNKYYKIFNRDVYPLHNVIYDENQHERTLHYNKQKEEDFFTTDYPKILISYLLGDISKDTLISLYKNFRGAIFNQAFSLYFKKEITKDHLLEIILDEDFNKTDVGAIFVCKKSFSNVNFYNFILDLDLDFLNNFVVKGTYVCLYSSFKNGEVDKFITFLFNDKEMHKKMHDNILLNFKEKDFPDKCLEQVNNLVLRSKLQLTLPEKNNSNKVKKI